MLQLGHARGFPLLLQNNAAHYLVWPPCTECLPLQPHVCNAVEAAEANAPQPPKPQPPPPQLYKLHMRHLPDNFVEREVADMIWRVLKIEVGNVSPLRPNAKTVRCW